MEYLLINRLLSHYRPRRVSYEATATQPMETLPHALAYILRANTDQQLPYDLLRVVLAKLDPDDLNRLNEVYSRRDFDHKILVHELRQRWERIEATFSRISTIPKVDLSASKLAKLLIFWDRLHKFTHMPIATSCTNSVFVTADGRVVQYKNSNMDVRIVDTEDLAQKLHQINGCNVYQQRRPAEYNNDGTEKNLVIVIDYMGQVYTWGICTAGCLGQGKTNEVRLPAQLGGLRGHRVVLVSVGSDHCVAVTDRGFLFAWGSDRQCGQDHVNATYSPLTNVRIPKRVTALSRSVVRYASAGGDHTLVVTDNGNLYSFGAGEYGQLGHGDYSDSYLPREVIVDGVSFATVAAGGFHSLAIASDRTVLSWGRNAYKNLGRDPTCVMSHTPSKVCGDVNRNFIHVAAGAANSFAVTLTGELYAWGLVREIGGVETIADAPEKVGWFSDPRRRAVAVSVPIEGLSDHKNMHTLVLTDTGDVYGSTDGAAINGWVKYGIRC